LESGKNVKALSAFQQAKSLDRFDLRSGLLSAQAMVAMGDTSSAIGEYRKLVSDSGFNELQILEHAIRTLSRVDLVLSLVEGGAPEKQLQVAKALERSGRWEASRAVYDYLYAALGDSAVLETYITSLNRHGEFDQMVKVLEKHLASNSNDWDIMEWLAKAYQRSGQFGQAIETYTRLWERFPDKLQYGNSLGHNFLRVMKYDSAEIVFQKVLRRQPDNIDALLGFSESLQYRRRYLEAITTYQHLLILQPEHFNARLHMALSYWRQGMLTQAVEQLKRCLELQPNNTEVQGYLNVLYDQLHIDKEVHK